MFTQKELKVAKMKLEGSQNNKIAEQLKVSEADISQTISRLSRKVKTVQDSTKLLMDIGMIQEGPRYLMTEKGRKLAGLPEKPAPIPQECELVRISTLRWKTVGFVESSSAIYAVPHPSLVVGEGTRIAVRGISGATVQVPSAEHSKILLKEQQGQSTELQ